MPTSPADKARERALRAWAQMDRRDRRRVLKHVNRMQALEDPVEANIAIWLAERQRRIWVRWWWIFPLLGGLTAAPRGWTAVAINVGIGAVFIALLAAAYAWRARRSIEINRAVVDKSRKGGRPKGTRKDPSAPKGRPTPRRDGPRKSAPTARRSRWRRS
jgi:hypothetical protein